jgi:hypothetical protein
LRDQFFEHFSTTVREDHLWTMIMMVVWLPEYRAYVEDPRFLEIMRGDGALDLWEHRGFPDGKNAIASKLASSRKVESMMAAPPYTHQSNGLSEESGLCRYSKGLRDVSADCGAGQGRCEALRTVSQHVR